MIHASLRSVNKTNWHEEQRTFSDVCRLRWWIFPEDSYLQYNLHSLQTLQVWLPSVSNYEQLT